MTERTLTGWHVLLIFGSAFAVIIGVNLTLAFNAVATFPGLETKNSYVASQRFDQERSAQEALGWNVSADFVGGELVLRIDDKYGAVSASIESATLGRATHVNQDITPEFTHDGAAFRASLPEIAQGNWNLRLVAVAPDGTQFRQRIIVGSNR